jgi:hypothetical protein
MTDRIIGCPHEEGIDYEGATCPARARLARDTAIAPRIDATRRRESPALL